MYAPETRNLLPDSTTLLFFVCRISAVFCQIAEVSNHALFQLIVLGTQVEFKNCPIKPGIFYILLSGESCF